MTVILFFCFFFNFALFRFKVFRCWIYKWKRPQYCTNCMYDYYSTILYKLYDYFAFVYLIYYIIHVENNWESTSIYSIKDHFTYCCFEILAPHSNVPTTTSCMVVTLISFFRRNSFFLEENAESKVSPTRTTWSH